MITGGDREPRLSAFERSPLMERQTSHIESLARYIRYLILTSSYRAQSGHPTSSLSAGRIVRTILSLIS